MSRLGLTASSIKPLEEAGAISVEVAERYRNPLAGMQPLERASEQELPSS